MAAAFTEGIAADSQQRYESIALDAVVAARSVQIGQSIEENLHLFIRLLADDLQAAKSIVPTMTNVVKTEDEVEIASIACELLDTASEYRYRIED